MAHNALCLSASSAFSSVKAFLNELAAAVEIPEREITPGIILESCAIADADDPTGMFESDRLDLDERVYGSYQVTVAGGLESDRPEAVLLPIELPPPPPPLLPPLPPPPRR